MIVIKDADLFGKKVDIAVDGDRVVEVGDVNCASPASSTKRTSRAAAAPRSQAALRLSAACPTPSR